MVFSWRNQSYASRTRLLTRLAQEGVRRVTSPSRRKERSESVVGKREVLWGLPVHLCVHTHEQTPPHGGPARAHAHTHTHTHAQTPPHGGPARAHSGSPAAAWPCTSPCSLAPQGYNQRLSQARITKKWHKQRTQVCPGGCPAPGGCPLAAPAPHPGTAGGPHDPTHPASRSKCSSPPLLF